MRVEREKVLTFLKLLGENECVSREPSPSLQHCCGGITCKLFMYYIYGCYLLSAAFMNIIDHLGFGCIDIVTTLQHTNYLLLHGGSFVLDNQ